MKNTFRILLALALSALAPLAGAGTFQSEKILSTDPSSGSIFPEIAYRGNNIHVVWVGFSPGLLGDIYYARSTNNGTSFTAPVNLSASATATTGSDRPHVAVDANGFIYVAWNAEGNVTSNIFVRRSTDGGASFSPAVSIATKPGFYTRITDLFADSANRVHLAYYTNGDTGGISGQIHHRMTCDGTNWGSDVAVTSQSVDGDVDNEQPRLAENGGRIFVTFRSSRHGNPQGGFPPYSIVMQSGTVSSCAISNWTFPARRMYGGIPFTYSSAYRPAVFTDSGGKMHLAFWSDDAGANVYYRNAAAPLGGFTTPFALTAIGVDHLQPGGLTSTPAQPSGGFQVPPGLASNGTTAFVAYQKHQGLSNGNEVGQVYMRESADNGSNWGVEVPISGGTSATTPRLAMGGSGNQNLAIVWADTRPTGTMRIYFRAYSLGPATGPVFAITPDTFNFGNREVSTTGATTLTLTNTGLAGNLTGNVQMTGDFAFTGSNCPVAMGPGASCTLNVTFTPTAIGARNGSITVPTDGGPASATLTGTGIARTGPSAFTDNVNAVVTGYYETILGRSPDGAGKAFWASEATRVSGLGADVREVFYAMSMQFFDSPEYAGRNRNDTGYITDLYKTFFVRDPDAAGLNFWLSQINGGMDRSSVLNNFLFSTEFNNFMTGIFGASNPRPEVNMVMDFYRGILGGLADSGGFNYWLGQLRTAQCQGPAAVAAKASELSSVFIGSAQYQNRDAARPVAERNKRYISDLFNAFLRRGADLAGYNFWVGQVESGAQTRDQVRQQYVNGPEFQARVNAVAAASCIP